MLINCIIPRFGIKRDLSRVEKMTSLLLQVVCILLLDISLAEELVGACFLEGGPLEGAADQEHLLESKIKKWKT